MDRDGTNEVIGRRSPQLARWLGERRQQCGVQHRQPCGPCHAPNAAVTWRSGTAHNITFAHNLGVGQQFDISVSRDAGVTWVPVTTFTTTSALSGSYSWMVNGPATSQARVRVTFAGGAGVTDDSDTDFAISSRIVVTAPNTAVSWAAGSVRTITWTHNLLATDTVDITFSPNGRVTWEDVASGVPNVQGSVNRSGSLVIVCRVTGVSPIFPLNYLTV